MRAQLCQRNSSHLTLNSYRNPSMGKGEQPELLCRVDFPLYAIASVSLFKKFCHLDASPFLTEIKNLTYCTLQISPRHLLVAGGGGAANTGVKNGFEVFQVPPH